MASSVAFPRAELTRKSSASIVSRSSRISLQSHRTTALEVHELFYGSLTESDTPTKAYDSLPPISDKSRSSAKSLEAVYEPNALYENPWLSAANRETIISIHNLVSHLVAIDAAIPRPFTFILYEYLRKYGGSNRKLDMLRVWSEIVDVCEADNFDGNRTSIIEHVMHVVLLPGLHTLVHSCATNDRHATFPGMSSTMPRPSLKLAMPYIGPIVPGWSPLHWKLRILTRLSFNESGRVAMHRDFVDVKDLMLLIPGVSAFQWASSTICAQVLSAVSTTFYPQHDSSGEEEDEYLYTAVRDRSVRRRFPQNVSKEYQRAPDVDRG